MGTLRDRNGSAPAQQDAARALHDAAGVVTYTNAREYSLSLGGKRPRQLLRIAKTGLLLSRGREVFSDFDSSVLRLKSTHVADCKPQAPPGRRWDFALELGLGLV